MFCTLRQSGYVLPRLVCLSLCLSVGLEEVADQFLTLEIRAHEIL